MTHGNGNGNSDRKTNGNGSGDRNGDRGAKGSGYRFGVLGAAQVLRPDGTEAPLPGPRLRALLTALAAAAGRTVPAGTLAAQLWTDAPPADEIAALQALVGRLRRTLGRDAVVSAPGGYRLAARPDDIDLFRFERLASDGAAALDAGDPATAARLLDEALGLWRGPALADLPGRGTDPLAARARTRHTEARRARLAAEVALGRPQAALPGLAELAADRPLDEPLAALRIRALRAAGRPAEALQAYEGVRSGLAARLGTDPGPELRALHAELLAADEEPVRHRATPEPGNLRARLTSFVGRDTELTDLAVQVRRHRLVTLLGPGGVGKTRLALEAADTARDRAPTDTWPDGVWLAELAPVRDEADVAGTVLTVLGAREPLSWTADTGARDPLDRLVEYCGRRRLLLVLDNCEHVVGAAARLADTVLAACPGVTVLATSREPLGVPGEAVRPVDPLPEEAALRLLAERGGSARPAFRVTDDPEACAEICRRLDGLPLAIELAAARLRALSPRQMADRLDDRFRLLTGGSRTALPRQQTLRAVVDWSWELLDAAERTVLRRLAVFSGGCTLALAEEVCAEPDTLDRLTSLVDKSLVVADPAPDGTMRYRLLETVADYAAERLAEAGEREATARRHLTAHRELVRTGERELRGPRQAAWLRVFEAEHDNIRAALRTAVELGEEQQGLCVVLCLNWFWQLRGHVTDARTWSAAVAALGPDPFLPPVRRAVPLHRRCTDTPPPWDDETLWEARRGVRLMAFASDGSQGAAALEKPENRAYLEAIADTYRPGMPQNCRHPGAMWFFVRLLLGEFRGLPDTMAATVESTREHGDDADIAFALLMRAKLLQEEGTDADEALARFEAVGDRWGIAESLSARGEAHDRAGRYAEAARDFERAMASAERIGAHSQVTVFQARLASVRLRLATTPAEREQAENLLLAAADAARTYNVEAVSTARLLLAQHYGRTGRVPLARHQLDVIERELIPGIAEMFTGMLLGLHAWLDCLNGDHARARERLAQAVRRLETLAYLVAPHMVLGQFPTAAWAMAGHGDPSDGARLLGAYDRHVADLAGTGFRQLPVDAEREIRDRAERELRAVLDDASLARAHAEGRALGLKEAAALVRRGAPRKGVV
ncbi:ATP-binding protein [Streptomyces sp. NRRL S-118]|uniref:ATP-binding protein n=1 Tax=Streptomyces sp. NRRL S-118 TaxID=1463881 RepID=UPI002D21A509|nr:BTAD domain-containing putative transcriptional regulator [Streptomyces sp. NRRL S-118]